MTKKRIRNKSTGRNYRAEYETYQGKPEQIKKRASRNAARAKMIKAGLAKKGDGKDINHRSGNPMKNDIKNLSVSSKRSNRSFPRTSTGRKKNPRD